MLAEPEHGASMGLVFGELVCWLVIDWPQTRRGLSPI